jgi:hypothetical protein
VIPARAPVPPIDAVAVSGAAASIVEAVEDVFVVLRRLGECLAVAWHAAATS